MKKLSVKAIKRARGMKVKTTVKAGIKFIGRF